MTREEQLLDFLKALGVEVRDRRPGSFSPLPYRGRVTTGEFAGFYRHDFDRDTRGLCLHHSAARQQPGGSLDALARGHLKRWASAGGLSYTLAVSPEGLVSLAWNLDRRLYSQGWEDVKTDPATLGDENIFFKGLLVEGNMKGPLNPTGTDEPTAAQMVAVVAVRRAFAELWGKTEVSGHFEHGKPACPGATLEAWVKANRVFGPGATPAPLPEPELATNEELQAVLAKLGFYSGRIDGIVGPVTRAGVKKFQASRGLVADGIVGPITRAALRQAFVEARGK